MLNVSGFARDICAVTTAFFQVAYRFLNLVKPTTTKKEIIKSFYYVFCSYYIANISGKFMGSFHVLNVSGFPRNIYAVTTAFFQVADQFLNLVREKEKKERKKELARSHQTI